MMLERSRGDADSHSSNANNLLVGRKCPPDSGPRGARPAPRYRGSELDHCFILADAGFINPALIRCSGNEEETAA
jgi:hypothetical protein